MATKGQKQFGDTILKEVLVMKEQGKTNREISEYFGFKDKFVIKQLIARYHRKQKKLDAGIIIRHKGRPRKDMELTTEQAKDNLIKQLKMENDLLRSFLQITGRR
jgi:hypothetical protein